MGIRAEITAFLLAAFLAAQGAACAAHDIDLGALGGVLAPAGDASVPPAAGSGGSASMMGGSGATGGSSGQPAGVGGSGGMAASAGAPAMAGDSGAPMNADAGDSGTAPATSSGCGAAPPTTDTSIEVNGMVATYIVDRPGDYDSSRAYPLIMAFRGAGVSADDFRGYLKLLPVAGAEAVLVHADCLNGASTWDLRRDTALFDELLAKLERNYCIDQQRIFAVGHGSGGPFVTALGCTRGDKLRGIAPLSGGPPSATCQGQLAVWISQGDGDFAAMNGRPNRDFWAARSQCDLRMPMPVEPDPCVEYRGCDAGYAIRYCEYAGGLDLPDFVAPGLWSFFKTL